MRDGEFQEIAHTGGKIEFAYDESSSGVSTTITHSNPWAVTMVQLCIAYDGKVLDFVPAGGMGAVIPYPQPSILALLLSDREGLFGQICPHCSSYFRSDGISGDTICPYCGRKENGTEFLTPNQCNFLGHFCQSFVKAMTEKRTIVLDLDRLLSDMKDNNPSWLYPEERQQKKNRCACYCTYDILGEYGLCPACGKPNFSGVIADKFDKFSQQFADVDENISDRENREVEWEKLTRCIAEFEALANVVKIHLTNLPLTQRRRKSIEQLSFQRILQASSALKEWFDIDILQDVSDNDRTFLNRMFNRRHVFTHNAGRVDQEYIDNTGDTTVRLNQTIRFRSREIRRLIPLVRKCSDNLISGYEALEVPN